MGEMDARFLEFKTQKILLTSLDKFVSQNILCKKLMQQNFIKLFLKIEIWMKVQLLATSIQTGATW